MLDFRFFKLNYFREVWTLPFYKNFWQKVFRGGIFESNYGTRDEFLLTFELHLWLMDLNFSWIWLFSSHLFCRVIWKGFCAMCNGSFSQVARWTSTHNFHLSCGAGTNMKGQGSFGLTINLAQASACVGLEDLVVCCCLSVAWFQKWIANTLQGLFPICLIFDSKGLESVNVKL